MFIKIINNYRYYYQNFFKNKIIYYLMYGQRIWIGVQELNDDKGYYQL